MRGRPPITPAESRYRGLTPLPPPTAPGGQLSPVQAGILVFAALFALFATLGHNGLLILGAAASLAMSALLWRRGEPAILLLLYLYHWLQATVGVVQATFAGLSMDEFARLPGKQGDAVALSHLALIVFAAALRAGAGKPVHAVRNTFSAICQRRSLATWFRIYLIVSALGWSAQIAGSIVPTLSQLTGGIALLRWAFYFLFAAVAFQRRQQGHPLLVATFLIELVMAIGGYFSEFKTVFFVTLLAAFMGGLRLSVAGLVSVSAVASATILFGVVWTSIKGEYRNFLSGGEQAQIIVVPFEERVAKLRELVAELTAQDLADGVDQMLKRLAYTEFFGAVLSYVPEHTPHENGAITADAIARPFMPRILFPSKSAIDDSARTNQYTGLGVTGADKGTSISLGWIAEFYIDFGAYLMMVAVFAYGAFLGRLKRFFETWSYSRGVLGSATAMAILLGALLFEWSITKVFGGLMASTLAALLVLRFVAPRWLGWLRV